MRADRHRAPLPRLCLVALVAVACACRTDTGQGAPAQDASVAQGDELRAALSRIVGEYQWHDDARRYVFSDPNAIARVVGEGTDRTITQLVDCLDDTTPTKTSLEGRPVPTGVLCHEALGQVVYYEPTTPSGDIAAAWPGHIQPTATPEELRAAKRAWQAVVRDRAYRRL